MNADEVQMDCVISHPPVLFGDVDRRAHRENCGTPLASSGAIRKGAGMRSSQAIDEGFDRLQEYLLAMTPGDQISVSLAVEVSGLETAQCDAVLNALLQAGLMMRLQHDAFVRCRLKLAEQSP
jgi:hypothetical protein